jgi:uncharacterized protein YjeT (DUF2065 family)
MPDTFQALAVTLLAVLPGAVYVWAAERQMGSWGTKASDRILRFVGMSAVFLAVYAVPLRWAWTNYLHVPYQTAQGKTRYKNLLLEGGDVTALWWILPILFVVIPFVAGTIVGVITARRRRFPRLAKWLSGPNPAPTAWDNLFSQRPHGFVRARLKGDPPLWLAGVFGKDSYASGYAEEPEDLYLEDGVKLLDDGTFDRDSAGKIVRTNGGLLLKRDDLDVIEFFSR